jgi:hypothetical protein
MDLAVRVAGDPAAIAAALVGEGFAAVHVVGPGSDVAAVVRIR